MITLEPMIHREQFCIAIKGRYSSQVFSFLRMFPNAVYSSTHRSYYVVYSLEVYENLRSNLLRAGESIDDHWGGGVDPGVRCKYLQQWLSVPASFREHLVKRRYSKSTCENYESQFRAFLAFIYPKTADEFTRDDIHAYQLFLVERRAVSHSTQNQAINAIKFYLEQVKKGERKEYYIERPRQELKLPTVLSEEEVKALFYRTHYIKHKCMLFLLYSAGLRVSELLNLKQSDIDSDRRMIYVRAGKGKKDRVTLFSASAYAYIVDYIALIKPKNWLFEGPDGRPYSASSVNKIIKRSARAAGITKRVSAHTLRHSFATHMLEQGTDLRYIQTLLGHESSRTTERYTQVTRKGFENLVSPLDRLGDLGGNKGI